jgi:5-methylcytosine-specific restriction endonuclease McrA
VPIKREKKWLYPDNWQRISLLVRKRAGGRCELCPAEHGRRHWLTGSRVVLTVHHINGDPTDNRRLNLLALCQRCHNKLDQPFRRPRKPRGGLFT